ncbi:MAG: hypothetical protein Q9195_004232 [Heterodermia aff. obscurata]
MIVYRVFFHPLRKFPGPSAASISKLWHVAKCRNSKNHLLMEELFTKYGSFVRIEILPQILDGPKNAFSKPAWYDNLRPYTGLNTHRSKIVHEHRRRIWDQGLTTKALGSYEKQVKIYATQLEDVIGQHAGQAIEINPFFYWFSFDVMGQFAFSKSFGMLKSQTWHESVQLLRAGLALVWPFSPVPCYDHRRQSQNSDTAAMTLVYIFYHLAKDRALLSKLQTELDTLPSMDDLHTLPHLNGIINETLRLHPAVPTGGLRQTPPGGVHVAGRFVPGNTVICAPRYSLARLESCFERANEFIPERWYSRPEMIKDKIAFAPFALGRYYCIGKNLAYSEMRYVVALLASKYDIAFAEGEDGKAVEGDMIDQFTACPGKLRVVFRVRGKRALDSGIWET